MAIGLSEDDRDLMRRYLYAVLKAFENDEDINQTTAILLRKVTMIANDDPGSRQHMVTAIGDLEEYAARPQRREAPADVIGNAVKVMRIATGEEGDVTSPASAAATLGRKAAPPGMAPE